MTTQVAHLFASKVFLNRCFGMCACMCTVLESLSVDMHGKKEV